MNWKTLLPVSAGLFLVTMVGCRSPLESIIRGQNPNIPAANRRPVQPADYRTAAIVYGGGSQVISSCPGGQCGSGWGNQGQFAGNRVEIQSDHHHHEWDYVPPQGLVYPPRNQPTGVVFYPYYTLKGPDCFFYQ